MIASSYLEVEALVRQTVEAALSSISGEKPQYCAVRRMLIDKLISHLESNAEWVERYRATGEILLPDSFDDGEDLQGPIHEVRLSIPGSVVVYSSGVIFLGIGAISARDCIALPVERDQDTSRRPKDEGRCFSSCPHNAQGKLTWGCCLQ